MSSQESHNAGRRDFDTQLEGMSTEEIKALLERENLSLADLGVKYSINVILYGAKNYGHNYENRKNSGITRPTPINCLMALLHAQAELREMPMDKFETLARVVSRIAMATEALWKITGDFDWPRQFTESPQKLLNQG